MKQRKTYINENGLIKIEDNQYADENIVYSYKDRIFDCDKPIKVYRNITRKKYSIVQDNKVVAHADQLMMFDCEFIVNEEGRQKVLREKRK